MKKFFIILIINFPIVRLNNNYISSELFDDEKNIKKQLSFIIEVLKKYGQININSINSDFKKFAINFLDNIKFNIKKTAYLKNDIDIRNNQVKYYNFIEFLKAYLKQENTITVQSFKSKKTFFIKNRGLDQNNIPFNSNYLFSTKYQIPDTKTENLIVPWLAEFSIENFSQYMKTSKKDLSLEKNSDSSIEEQEEEEEQDDDDNKTFTQKYYRKIIQKADETQILNDLYESYYNIITNTKVTISNKQEQSKILRSLQTKSNIRFEDLLNEQNIINKSDDLNNQINQVNLIDTIKKEKINGVEDESNGPHNIKIHEINNDSHNITDHIKVKISPYAILIQINTLIIIGIFFWILPIFLLGINSLNNKMDSIVNPTPWDDKTQILDLSLENFNELLTVNSN
jgi:hypothetical protein